MATPTDRKYTNTHEWVTLDGKTAGITQYQADHLGTCTAASLPSGGLNATAGQNVGSLTGSRNNATMHTPIGGSVDRNEWLNDHPGDVSSNPYGTVVLNISNPNTSDLNSLKTAAQYDAYVNTLPMP
jgi:glycine cleavage system H protein